MLETRNLQAISLTADEYFASPGLSNSGMKDLAISPLRYWHLWINPDRPMREATDAMKLGTALHCAVLERDEVFQSRYARAVAAEDYPVLLDSIADIREWLTSKGFKPTGTRKYELIEQALAAMAAIGEYVPILAHEDRRFATENQGKTILSPDDWQRVCGMACALISESAMVPLLAQGRPEVALSAIDPETGVRLKCRCDWVAPDFTLDLKTFSTKGRGSVDKAVSDAIYYEGYYRQAFLYDYIRTLATGEKAEFIMPFVESEQPHETRIKRLYDGGNLYWQMARIEVLSLIRLYANCVEQFGDRPWRTGQKIEPLIDEDMRQIGFS